MAGVEGERINAPGAVEQFSPGHAILIFFSSRRILRRKFFTVFLSLALSGCGPNWRYNCLQVIRCWCLSAKVR